MGVTCTAADEEGFMCEHCRSTHFRCVTELCYRCVTYVMHNCDRWQCCCVGAMHACFVT